MYVYILICNLFFVWDPTAHSASPCSQSNAAHCQLWPCSAQLCAAGEALLLCGSAEAALGNPHLLYPSSSAPALSHTADQQGGAAEDVWQEQHLGPVRSPVHTQQSLAADTPSAGDGEGREALLEAMPQPGLSKDLDKWFESYWNHCPPGKKERVLTKAQKPWVCLVLLLLSSLCCCLIHHRHPFLLDQVSAFSSFNSLVSHSMCLPIMMPVFITPMWEKNHAWEKEKSEDYKYIFLAFCT